MTGLILHPKRAGILRALRTLLTPVGAWCKGAYARTAGGQPTHSHDKSARSYCLIGGINLVVDEDERTNVEGLIRKTCNIPNLAQFNDNATQEGVLAVINRTIAHVENQ